MAKMPHNTWGIRVGIDGRRRCYGMLQVQRPSTAKQSTFVLELSQDVEWLYAASLENNGNNFISLVS